MFYFWNFLNLSYKIYSGACYCLKLKLINKYLHRYYSIISRTGPNNLALLARAVRIKNTDCKEINDEFAN